MLQFELLVLGLKTQTTARVVIKVHECTIVALRAWCRKHVSRVRIASCSSKMLRVRHENPTFQACTNVDKAPCLLLDSIPPFPPLYSQGVTNSNNKSVNLISQLDSKNRNRKSENEIVRVDTDLIMLNNGNARRRGTFWWSDPTRKISPTHLHNSEMFKCGGLCATQKNTQRLKIARYQIVGNPLEE